MINNLNINGTEVLTYITSSPCHGAAISLAISIFSNVYYNNNIKRVFSEGILCMCITIGLVSSLEFF
ncbi:TPA: phage holin family protein, partial [Enterobacter asburiae]|nr:phage holin family protein [Enterobacter asburiae]